MNLHYLKNKVIVITGASSGIGFACASLALKNGAKVILISRTISSKKGYFEEQGAGEHNMLLFDVDVTDFLAVQNAMREGIKQFGTIDILISNAGISMRALFKDADIKVLHQLMDVNFWGTVHMVKSVLPIMLKNNSGSIIAISSIAGFKGLPSRTGYSASKFAINGFMDSLRIELLSTQIKVSLVAPGYTSSNIRKTALNAVGLAQAETPLDESKLMSAEAVALAVYEAVLNGAREKVLTFEGKATYWFRCLIPARLDRLIFNKLKKEPNSPF